MSKDFDNHQMCYFARYCVEYMRGNDREASLQTMDSLLYSWKTERPGEYCDIQPVQRMTLQLGKTPSDILGLRGPQNEKPSDS